MLTLNHLPPPPSDELITACENDGQLRAFTKSELKQKIHEWVSRNILIKIYKFSIRVVI